MVFSREFSPEEKEYIVKWQHAKSPGMIASDLNKWPENKNDPRQTSGIRNFLYKRRRQQVPTTQE